MHPGVAVTVAASVVVLAVAGFGPRGFPALWSGRTSLSPTTPPDSWRWSVGAWRRVARALVVNIALLFLGALSVLAAWLDATVSDVLTGATVVVCVLWFTELAWGRPRFLIPPAWRQPPQE